jgi:putative ABC transport system ATP-binding protein
MTPVPANEPAGRAASGAAASEPAEPLLELLGVSKDYESGAGVVHALRAVDLVIARGDFVAIVGASGSGKSTMMNILGCLDRPTRGTYRLAGVPVGGRGNDARAIVRNRLIGFIFQGFNLLSRTTALENVELPLQYRGIGGGDRRRRAMEALGAVGLGDRVHHTPNQLSGGQQQRVAIARALVTNPPLLLADEPTGNLDTRTSLEVLALLQRLNRERGITIVLVTHEHDIAACASRVVSMRDGRIVSDVVQASPSDAAAELARLPDAVEEAPPASLGSPQVEAARRLGGPVPIAVYAAMAAGALLGAIAGLAYTGLVLGAQVKWIPLILAVLGESLLGARYARRRLGRPLTNDQRARIAIGYTVGLALAAVPVAWLALPRLPVAVLDKLDQISSGGVALGLAFVVLALGALALLRYLLLALFSTRAPLAAR